MGFFAIIWFSFAVACAMLAQKKNRNSVAWFVLGFIGGIFSLVLLLLLSPINRYDNSYNNPYNNGYDSSSFGNNTNMPLYKKCPFCAEQIMNEAIICKHCGSDLNSNSNNY